MKREAPLYDRRRLEAMVMAHKMRVHLMRKGAGKTRHTAGVKAPSEREGGGRCFLPPPF